MSRISYSTLDLACACWRSCPNGLDSSVPRYSDEGDHQSFVGRSRRFKSALLRVRIFCPTRGSVLTMRHLLVRDELNYRLISHLRFLQLKRSC